MIIDKLQTKRLYNLKVHNFVFLSVIYACILSKLLNLWAISFKHFEMTNNCFFTLFWSIIVFIYIFETWWGMWRDDQKFKPTFFNLTVLLIHPYLTYFVIQCLLPSETIGKDSKIIFFENASWFFAVSVVTLTYLVCMKRIVQATGFGNRSNRFRYSAIAFFFLLAIISFFNRGFFFIGFNYLGFVICATLLYRFIKSFQGHSFILRKKSKDEFIKDITWLAKLPHRLSAKQDFHIGFALVEKNDPTENDLEKLNEKLRGYDLITAGRDDVIYIFLPFIKSKKDFQTIGDKITEVFGPIKIKFGSGKFHLVETKNRKKKEQDFTNQLSSIINDSSDGYKDLG